MMTVRIILSVFSFFAAWGVSAAYRMFYSPITGVATAQAVNDDSGAGYATAKFIREGGCENLIAFALLFALFIIWIGPICRLFKSKNKNTN